MKTALLFLIFFLTADKEKVDTDGDKNKERTESDFQSNDFCIIRQHIIPSHLYFFKHPSISRRIRYSEGLLNQKVCTLLRCSQLLSKVLEDVEDDAVRPPKALLHHILSSTSRLTHHLRMILFKHLSYYTHLLVDCGYHIFHSRKRRCRSISGPVPPHAVGTLDC